jgi:hypothetical protein
MSGRDRLPVSGVLRGTRLPVDLNKIEAGKRQMLASIRAE